MKHVKIQDSLKINDWPSSISMHFVHVMSCTSSMSQVQNITVYLISIHQVAIEFDWSIPRTKQCDSFYRLSVFLHVLGTHKKCMGYFTGHALHKAVYRSWIWTHEHHPSDMFIRCTWKVHVTQRNLFYFKGYLIVCEV